TALDPRINRSVEGVALEYVVEHHGRGRSGDQHAEDGYGMRRAIADLETEEPGDERADQRCQRDDQVKRSHVHRLSAEATVGGGRRRAQPLRWSRSSTLMVFRLRNRATRIASPIADSAAATVRMKNTNTCPAVSPRK